MLHVWLRSQHSPLAVWHAETSAWQTVEGWQQLQDYISYSNYKANSNKSLCLYFPTSHMLQVDTELNTAQLKQLGNTGKQYLFEETALSPIEQLTLRQVAQPNLSYIYALAQHDIEAWQQSAVLAGLSISAVLPDFLLLPVLEEGAGQQVVLYQDSATTLLRQADYQGLAVSYLPLLFERLPHLSEVCTVPTIEDTDNDDFNSEIEDFIFEQQLLLTPLALAPTPIEHPERHTLNFFSKSSDAKLSPYLRVAAMVALSALTLQIATDAVQWYRYDAAARDTEQAVGAQYQSWFPDERLNPRNNLETQMRTKLRTDTQESSSMAALARISPLIKQSSLQAQSLSIQPTALSFTLIAPDRDRLDQFAATLNEQGLSANLDRVNSNEQGQFSGQITVNIVDNSNNESAESASNTMTAVNTTDS